MKKEEITKSLCCNAEIDCRGGGYDGEDICPIEDYCTRCGQTLAVNGLQVDILDPTTGKKIRKGKK